MLLSIQAGLFSDAHPGEVTGPEEWRQHVSGRAPGPINEERCMLFLATTHNMFRRSSGWSEQLIRAGASAEAMSIVLEIASYERHQHDGRHSAEEPSATGSQ